MTELLVTAVGQDVFEKIPSEISAKVEEAFQSKVLAVESLQCEVERVKADYGNAQFFTLAIIYLISICIYLMRSFCNNNYNNCCIQEQKCYEFDKKIIDISSRLDGEAATALKATEHCKDLGNYYL